MHPIHSPVVVSPKFSVCAALVAVTLWSIAPLLAELARTTAPSSAHGTYFIGWRAGDAATQPPGADAGMFAGLAGQCVAGYSHADRGRRE